MVEEMKGLGLSWTGLNVEFKRMVIALEETLLRCRSCLVLSTKQ
jgi:hypothetical protein